MKKTLLTSVLILTLTLAGCGTSDSNTDKSKENSTEGVTATADTLGNSASNQGSDTAYLDKNNFKNNYTPFSFTDECLYTNLFISNETSVVFPNWDDNNNISVINEPLGDGTIDTSSVSDFVSYPAYSLTVINNIVYFADASKKNSLAGIDLATKAYAPIIADSNVKNIIGDKNIVYFINSKRNSNLQSYDTMNKSYKTVCFDNVGTYFISGNFILYQNKSDKSRLYKINIDGTEKEQLTEFSVDSFTQYDGKIIAINSSDNNNLYSIDLTNLDTQRLAVMNGENLKDGNGKLYFIDVNNSRHLSTMEIDMNAEKPEVTFTDISKESINDYYATDKGVFIQRSADVNNGYIVLKNN
ncbi:MAG: DUF5050 domain-containing protein [Clostridium sp.]|nr:DUF5050 domain-containing protein [Clostridium sp.]